MISDLSLYRLHPYEEAVGLLKELEENQESIIAQLGHLNVILPKSMDEKLRSHLGQRIAILRTDLPNKLYLLRVLPSNHAETSQLTTRSAQIYEVL